jgi:hypothetical protein
VYGVCDVIVVKESEGLFVGDEVYIESNFVYIFVGIL